MTEYFASPSPEISLREKTHMEAVEHPEKAGEEALTLGELQASAARILNVIARSGCYEGSAPYGEQFGELPWMGRCERGERF